MYPHHDYSTRQGGPPDGGDLGLRGEGRIGRGWRLATLSWNVIEADRSLLALPLLLLLCQGVAGALIFLPTGFWSLDMHSTEPLFLGAALAAYPFNFLSTFFGVAFVAVLRAHNAGQPATMGDGLRFARTRLRAIAGWAALTTLVGLAIQALERARGGAIAARIAGWILGAAWALATVFVVPVLASTDLGAVAAAKESAQIVRKRFGETIAGGTVIAVAFGLLFIPIGLLAVVGYSMSSGSPAFGFCVIVIAAALALIVFAAQFAVESVFRVALYDFAVAGTAQGPFTEHDLAAGLQTKRRLFRRNR